MVMVSHTHNFIFLKTRKTAGTSIEMALQPFCTNPDDDVLEKTECLISEKGIVGARLPGHMVQGENRPRYFNHMPARLAKLQLGLDIWQSYFKISSIRNPFSRAVSFFHFRERSDPQFENADFSEVQKRFRHHILNDKWPDDFAVTHTDNHYEPDTTIRLEHLAKDIAAISDRLDLKIDVANFPKAKFLPHLRRRPVSEYFDIETTEFVKARMAWVFDRFDYSPNPNDIPNQNEVPQ